MRAEHIAAADELSAAGIFRLFLRFYQKSFFISLHYFQKKGKIKRINKFFTIEVSDYEKENC